MSKHKAKKTPQRKYRIGLGFPSGDGRCSTAVAGWIANAMMERFRDPELVDLIEEVKVFFVQRFPTNTTRNVITQTAQQNNIDILFCCDDDSAPNHDFFKRAFQFLIKQEVPSLIGCPYLSSDHNCQVFRFSTKQGSDPLCPMWEIVRIPREEAIFKQGIERIGSIGSHTFAIDMRCFDAISKPYFQYAFDQAELNTLETEEMRAWRKMVEKGIPLYVDWECWSGHFKSMCLQPLAPMTPEQIPEWYLERAKEYLLHCPEGRKRLEDQKSMEISPFGEQQ